MIWTPRQFAVPCCLFRAATLLLIAFLHLGAAAPFAGSVAKTDESRPLLNAAIDADSRAFFTKPRRYARADGRRELNDQEHFASNATGIASSNSTGALVRRKRTHHHHHHIHAGHHDGGDAGFAQNFDTALFKTVGILDSNTCVSRFVCEVVARRGVHSFVGTTIGSLFKGLAHAPPTSPAHALWRAAAIGKHGWLPVCTSAFPHCSSPMSTVFSILNMIG